MTQPSARTITAYNNARAAFIEAKADHERRLNFVRRIAFDPNKPAGDRRLWCRLLIHVGTSDDFTRAQDVLDRIGDYGISTPPRRPLILLAGLALILLAVLAGLALSLTLEPPAVLDRAQTETIK